MESRLIIELIQQSPMIHFQHDEDGATLRATDVKPRLDRFLIEEYKKENDGGNVPKDWVQPGQSEALKYQMRIKTPNEKADSKEPLKGLYFGNMGDRTRKKQMISYKKPIQIEITCFVKELREYIKKKDKLFFFLNNFGTRQGKGFGSFIISGSAAEAEALLSAYYDKKTIYRMVYPGEITAENILYDVNEVYKILKSGINFNNVYIKSYLTEYFLKKGIEGEKRWMKTTGIAPVVVTQGKMSSGGVKNPRYIRAILGTGEVQSWISEDGNHKPKKTFKNGKWVTEREEIKVKSTEIARMPSPIVFKIIENTLYIIPYEPQKEIYGKSFNFTGRKTNNLQVPDPAKDHFSIDELMAGFMDYFNKEKGKYSKMPKGKKDNSNGGQPFFFIHRVMLDTVNKTNEEVTS